MRRGDRGSADVKVTMAGLPCLAVLLVALTLAGCAASDERDRGPLETIGPAPAFSLTTQHGEELSLERLRGKVVVVTFVFTTCVQGCSPLTAKLAAISERLGPELAPDVFLTFVTLTPERDTPEVLQRFAEVRGLNLDRSALLTGTPDEIRSVATAYGVAYWDVPDGDLGHTFLTSIIDQSGTLRVQYLGIKFDPDEFLGDLLSLLKEEA